jgi:CheY-like chemotaxis protein
LAEVIPLVRRPRIVVAEDDPALRLALVIALKADGYEVLEAADGPALVDLIGDQLAALPGTVPLDLIITDVHMPGLTGIQALATMGQLAGSTPCIVITAHLTPELEARARLLGAEAVFRKPFDVDDLRTAVMNLVRRPGSEASGPKHAA